MLHPRVSVRPRSARARLFGLLAAAAVLVPGCVTAPEPPDLTLEPPASFSVSGEEAVPERWWETFDDAGLDAQVEQALDGNLSLDVAWARLREARAVVDRESAQLRPTVDAFGEFDIFRGTGSDDEVLTLGLAAGYEVDLWGRIEALTDAEALRAEAALSDYRAAAVTLSAEVALTWFGIAEASAQVELLERQERANEQILELIRARVGSGQLRGVDALRQAELLEATREESIGAEARRRILTHRMAVLLGRVPDGRSPLPDAALTELPPFPDTGLPADLLRRRPDVERSRQLVLAADRSLAAAMSDRYPRLDLTAVLSTTEDDGDALFDDWVRSFAAGLVQPLFDGGRREGEIDRTAAVRDRRLAEYGQVVLESFREVEDALVREDEQRRRFASLERQVSLAERSVERLRTDYLNGVGEYLDVLAALIDEQRLRRELLESRLFLIESRIALYRALAGGFSTSRETESEAAAETKSEEETTK